MEKAIHSLVDGQYRRNSDEAKVLAAAVVSAKVEHSRVASPVSAGHDLRESRTAGAVQMNFDYIEPRRVDHWDRARSSWEVTETNNIGLSQMSSQEHSEQVRRYCIDTAART